MTTLIPKKWEYTVTDADGNFIRTINSKYWKRNNCRLIIRTFSDSDKTDISINVDSDFAISIPMVTNLTAPRRFNVEPLKLTLANQSFDDLYEVNDFTADVDLAAEAMTEFQEILDFLDYLDCKGEKDEDSADSAQYDAPRAPIFDADDVEEGLKDCLSTGLYPDDRELTDKGKKAIGNILNLKDNLKREYLDDHLRAGWEYKNGNEVKNPFAQNKTALDIAIIFAINDMIFTLNNN